MSEAKGLNRLLPLHRVMSGASYGGGYSGQGLLRTGMAGLVGAALAVGAGSLESRAQQALGQDVAKIAYQQTNLSSLGVPSVEGLKPYHTKWLDKTDKIAGKETRQDMYQIGVAIVGTYSISNRIYAVAFDTDGKPPLEHAFIDKDGSGKFVAFSPKDPVVVPEWVIRQVVSAKDLNQ